MLTTLGAFCEMAARTAELCREVGLRDVFIDDVGNVLGSGGAGATTPPVVLAAHLDTVFGPDVRVGVERRGREAVYSLADQHVAHIVADAVHHSKEEP